MNKKIILTIINILFFYGNTLAQAPQGYYDMADQKKSSGLKSAMYNIIKSHIQLGYYESSQYFKSTDWHPNNYFWDMYSNYQRTSFSGMNREHNMPKSWWSTYPEGTVAYTDLHNLYPSDATANGAKSNYPLGEVGVATFNNGVVKVGQNTASPVYLSAVFEPADEYKGDFARTYFYMVTCYEDYASNWRSLGTTSMLNNEFYPVFKNWAIDMLLKWHRDDPVSQKEIDRNNAVFTLQQNRNPFVDFPDLAEYIWGNKTDDVFVVENKTDDPVLITPTNDITVNFGEVLQNQSVIKYLPVRGKGLTGYMTALLRNNTDGYFSIESTSISTSLINSNNGYQFKVTYTPRDLGEHSANIIFLDGGIVGSVKVEISGYCVSEVSSIEDEMLATTNVYTTKDYIHFKNIKENSLIEIYSINGQKVMSFNLSENKVYFDRKGMYIIKIENKVYKIVN